MVTRRNFLGASAAIVAGSTTLVAGMAARQSNGQAEAQLPAGQAGTTPQTLDLADHGRLAINGLLGSLDPAADYEGVFLNILDVNPPYMLHWSTMVSGVMPKFVAALPMLRIMSGSDQSKDLEQGFMDSMVRNMEEDGLVYDRAVKSRPWNVGVYYGKADWNEDYANMAGNGRMISGLLFWHQATGDDAWLKRAQRTAERMLDLAIVDGDQAWYPNPGLGNDFSYPRVSGWTTRKPPQSANEGFEGGAMFYHFQPLRGFTRFYKATGDERFLELSRKFANLGMQSKFWNGAGDMEPRASAERGHFHLHFHASMAAVRSALDYALIADDQRVQQFANDSYNYARQTGIKRLGLFPTHGEGTEGCSIADMIGMAVTLTDAGIGDYWDDVEAYARNGLLCAQATDLDELQRVSKAGKNRPRESNDATLAGHFDSRFQAANNKGVLPGQEIHDRVLERTIGAFGHVIGARYQSPMMMHCCTGNCCQALYYAWDGIVRREGDDSVTVNMWLNRRSPWVDVQSWQPHSGKLAVQNKGMSQIAVRKPGWAARGNLRCQVNGVDAQPKWVGNRMMFSGLKGNELITLECALPIESTEYTLVNISSPMDSKERYRIDFRGPTAVAAERLALGNENSPYYLGKEDHNWYRIFRREHMRTDDAPMAPTPSYVHGDRLIHWTVV
jgi:hypothetical protein